MLDLTMNFESNIFRAAEYIKSGKMVIMVDEADRENEGDLVFAAEHCTPQLINFMAKEARGLICLTLEPEIINRLKLPMMSDSTKTSPNQSTAFTVSIEAKVGVTTGISAADRSKTIQVAINPHAVPDDIVVPGHIFPLRAKSGGVLERAGHTEGSVDLAKLAGLSGAAVICEIMNDDGTMARLPDLEKFGLKHDIPIVSISDLIRYRLVREAVVSEVSRGIIQTKTGSFESVLFHNQNTGQKHLALIKGTSLYNHTVDVRVHSQRPFADVFAIQSSEAGFRLDYGLKLLNESEHGIFLYLTYEEPNLLIEEDYHWLLNAQAKDPSKVEPSKMSDKMVGTGAQILRALGVKKMRIHSTTPRSFVGLNGYGLEVVESKIMERD